MKIAGIYARVSSARQQKEETIASQLDALHAYAQAHGYVVGPSTSTRMTATAAPIWIARDWTGYATR